MSDEILVDLKMKMAMNPDLLFYTSVMYGLEFIFGETRYNTAATDGLKVIFTKSFLMGLPEEERLGLMLHEIRHVTDMHQFRCAGRDPQIWNEAGDHVINLDITEAGFKLPQLIDPNTGESNICCDKQFKDMAVEEVYEKLVEQGSKGNPMTPDLMEVGSTGEEGEGNEGNTLSSGSSDGVPSEAQKALSEDLESEIKDLLIQAVQMTERTAEGNLAGKVPNHILRMVDAWLNPVVPWEAILQNYMNQKCKEEYSWQRPSRRYLAHSMYIPSLYSEQLGNIHFFIDGSCSVSKRMFDMQVGQIKWIKHNLNPKELRIIVFNTRIVDEFIFNEHEGIDVEFQARGGTAVGEIVKYMEKHTAEVNIILTDGYFNQVSLSNVKDDILCLIYDNNNFNWEGSKTIYLPPEKKYESYDT